jgi:hypothetical protein
MEKESATFTCELSKPDRKDGKWQFKGEDITVSEKFKMVTAGTKQSLIVADLTLAEQGPYTYRIEEVSTEATLTITGQCTQTLGV